MNLKQATAALALSTAFAAGPVLAADSDKDWSDLDILFLIWSESSNPFFEPMINAVNDAAEDHGVNVDIQFGEEDPVIQSNILETAIANGIDGIAVTIADDNAYDDLICQARDAGIPVITFNIDDSEGADGNCRMAFVGQNFVEAGYVIGKRMIEEHGLAEGDHVFTPVEAPEATYAVLRHAGVAKAMDEIGATTEVLGTSNDGGQALNLMTQYLLGHPDTDAVVGLGYTPTSSAVQAVKDAGLEIPAGGFDVGASILSDIASGELTATVDQQPYSQGYYAITQIALALKYGLWPSDMATGGLGVIDSTNYEIAEQWAAEAR